MTVFVIVAAAWLLLILIGRWLAIRAGKNFEIEDARRRSYAARNVESEAASNGGNPGLHPTRREPRS